ncbi:MAG: hypothetical protein Q3996_02245 [Candidatus Saccharibacteria bacterium]|nr:hypothetical protein [Candidatus Saccharibacteria bacterium]
MSGFLKKPSHKVANLVSSLIYILLNIALALAVIMIIDLFDSIWLAMALIVLSKWRVFAVKIRFWWANIMANFVDFLVGVSYVSIVYLLGDAQLFAQLAIAGLYLIWLLLIKPATNCRMIVLQGLVAIFLTNTMLSTFGSNLAVSFFVLAEMLVGYHVMRHFLINCESDNDSLRLISGIWALIMAELAWVCWHWLIGYDIAWGLRLSQFSIISTLMTFMAYKILNYANSESGGERQALKLDLVVSVIFVVIAILSMLLFFSKVQAV